MISLVYKSKASPSFRYEDIQFMLNQARALNKENNITGCLLYYQGKFLQYIEGDEDKIMELFGKIKVDDRHFDVKLLSYDYTTERVFHNWEMAYEDFQGTNHQLEYLKLYVSLFIEIPKKALNENRTSQSFWNMVRKLITQESIDR